MRNRTESAIGREKRQGKDKCLCRTREEGDEIAPVHLLRSQIRIDPVASEKLTHTSRQFP